MWDSWPVTSFYLIQLPHDIRRDMGQIADAGDHHGIHELAFERIQEEFDPFGPTANSSDGSRSADEDGVGTEGQHFEDVFAVTDTAIDENGDPPFDSCGDIRQDIGRTGHAVEDAAAVVADDDAWAPASAQETASSADMTPLTMKGSLIAWTTSAMSRALLGYGVTENPHVNQRRRIDVAGNGKSAGFFGLMGFLNDLVVAAGLDSRDDDARPFLTRCNA